MGPESKWILSTHLNSPSACWAREKKFFEDISGCKWEDNIFPYINFLNVATIFSCYPT